MNNERFKKLYFYENLLLYLLHINYLKNNKTVDVISHYTSIDVLSLLLDDSSTKSGSIRLCSLTSANDPKEGSVLYDLLAVGIKDNDLINNINKKDSHD